MSSKRERWLRTSAPAYDPAQTDMRRRYEYERHLLRYALFQYRTDNDPAWRALETSSRKTLVELERQRKGGD